MKGGDFSWPPVGTFRGHQWGPQLATSEYFLMATDTLPASQANVARSGQDGAGALCDVS